MIWERGISQPILFNDSHTTAERWPNKLEMVLHRDDLEHFVLNCVDLTWNDPDCNTAYITLDSLFLSNFLVEFITVLQYFKNEHQILTSAS
jgi:hypothetical protein